VTNGTEHALVYTKLEFKGWIDTLVDKFFMLNYMQLVVAVIVAVAGIANTLVISVAERHREFGIIRSIGGYRAQIRKMVLLEALSIAVVGVFVGAIAALFNTEFLSRTVSTVLAGYDVPFYFPWLLILETLPAVIAVSLLAGWIPARHAMQASVIEAIGYE
jgi:putative ABC transport system permease protein